MIRALTVTSIPSTLKSVRNPSPAATTASPDLLALDRQVCFALAVASRNVIALYRPLLEPMGITHPQYLVMLALWEETPSRSPSWRAG